MCASRGMWDGPYEHIKTWDELSRPLAYEKNYYQRITKNVFGVGGQPSEIWLAVNVLKPAH